jgi:hypothetical protein
LARERKTKETALAAIAKLGTVTRYIDTRTSHTHTDLDKLLQQAQNQRVMLIAYKERMGKSTALTYLSMHIKQKFPNKWVVRIDLNDDTEPMKALKQRLIDKTKAVDSVSTKLLNLKCG